MLSEHLLQHMQLQASIDQQLAERAYNTPAAQAQRMRAAGLNPDMQDIDNGNGSISAGVGSPSGESASAQSARTAQAISSMVELLPQAIQTVQSMQLHSQNMSMNELELMAAAEKQHYLSKRETSSASSFDFASSVFSNFSKTL